MTTLKSFPREDRSLVNEELFEEDGERSRIREENLSGELRDVGVSADLDAIGSAIDDILNDEGEFDARHEIDAELAPIVHQNTDLTRREASEAGIWHWMATMWRPDFVRHRWPYSASERTYSSMREKFLGGGTDIYSNAFGRLWWMAELSYDEERSDPYELTRRVVRFQMLANRLFDPQFARYRPAVIAFGEVILEESEAEEVSSVSKLVQHSNARFNQALSSIQLESRDKDDLRGIVQSVVEGVKEDYDV
ncbi:hypothetical protein GLW36_05820 [Halorubrum terrestre]|uniref:Uncharacterized protein n=1 Tax=Halorubrum distributum TaxID=29283 RepID=A0A6B1ID59_9EURY|nr:DUF6339 family protein [Halorubrum terrestre]MYL16166.1 hypothetical protein [Halorubrum terrestre]